MLLSGRSRVRIPASVPKRKRALCPLPFWFIIQKGFEAANSKRASDAFAAAGFFVAEREAAGLRRLRDSMRKKGIPASVPRKALVNQGFFVLHILNVRYKSLLKTVFGTHLGTLFCA